MSFSVALYYNYSQAPGWNEIGDYNWLNQTVIDLAPAAETNVTINWTITTISSPLNFYGNYTLKAVRMHSHLNDGGVADTISANDIGYSWVWVMLGEDINGNNIVDIFDIATISAYWYPGPPAGPLGYNPATDLDFNGSIDISDIDICSAHWGDTQPY